jgi:hypothetical protein
LAQAGSHFQQVIPNMHELIQKTAIRNNRFTVYPGKALHRYVLEPFWFEIKNHDMSALEEAVLRVPFLLNIAPVVWLSGLQLRTDAIDATLHASLNRLRDLFRTEYPGIRWQGNLVPDRVERHDPNAAASASRPALLFSGGLDSVTSLYRHLAEQPLLITVHGADVRPEDTTSWKALSGLAAGYAREHNLESVLVQSNVVDFLNQQRLSTIAGAEVNWWGNVQHGMGLAGLALPVCHAHGCATVLMASSLWEAAEKMAPVHWGSSSAIAERIRFRSLTVQDDYPVPRQEKLEYLKRLEDGHGARPRLRVCYKSREGINCGRCEKCLRTVTGMLIAGIRMLDPYGFPETATQYARRLRALFESGSVRMGSYNVCVWNDMKSHVHEHAYYRELGYGDELVEYLRWLQDFDFNHYYSRQRDHRPWGARLRRFMSRWFPRVYYHLKCFVRRSRSG